jgi:hypothetical protein
MKRQINKMLFALAAASALGTCIASGAATSSATVDLRGYWREVRNGHERFCNVESRGHYLQNVCYSRAELKRRLLPGSSAAGPMAAPGPALVFPTSFYIAAGRPNGG